MDWTPANRNGPPLEPSRDDGDECHASAHRCLGESAMLSSERKSSALLRGVPSGNLRGAARDVRGGSGDEPGSSAPLHINTAVLPTLYPGLGPTDTAALQWRAFLEGSSQGGPCSPIPSTPNASVDVQDLTPPPSQPSSPSPSHGLRLGPLHRPHSPEFSHPRWDAVTTSRTLFTDSASQPATGEEVNLTKSRSVNGSTGSRSEGLSSKMSGSIGRYSSRPPSPYGGSSSCSTSRMADSGAPVVVLRETPSHTTVGDERESGGTGHAAVEAASPAEEDTLGRGSQSDPSSVKRGNDGRAPATSAPVSVPSPGRSASSSSALKGAPSDPSREEDARRIGSCCITPMTAMPPPAPIEPTVPHPASCPWTYLLSDLKSGAAVGLDPDLGSTDPVATARLEALLTSSGARAVPAREGQLGSGILAVVCRPDRAARWLDLGCHILSDKALIRCACGEC